MGFGFTAPQKISDLLFYFALEWFVETQTMAYFVDVGCATRHGIWNEEGGE
jgi:hypothetical protein